MPSAPIISFFFLSVFVSRGREFLEYFGGSHGFQRGWSGEQLSPTENRETRFNSILFKHQYKE